jgi:hypothetical protein
MLKHSRKIGKSKADNRGTERDNQGKVYCMLIEEGSSRNRGEISVIIIDNNP